jgi:RHH-type transcriptional regulator, rel operon repressor / antitoxin RelB
MKILHCIQHNIFWSIAVESSVLTLRLNNNTKDKLDKLANATQRSKSFLAAEAINRYLEVEAWQISEIELAMNEADQGDFASEAQVKALASKYAG